MVDVEDHGGPAGAASPLSPARLPSSGTHHLDSQLPATHEQSLQMMFLFWKMQPHVTVAAPSARDLTPNTIPVHLASFGQCERDTIVCAAGWRREGGIEPIPAAGPSLSFHLHSQLSLVLICSLETETSIYQVLGPK